MGFSTMAATESHFHSQDSNGDVAFASFQRVVDCLKDIAQVSNTNMQWWRLRKILSK
jgi:hypothetical protein